MFKVRGKRETVSYQLPFGACVYENRFHIRYTFDYAGEW